MSKKPIYLLPAPWPYKILLFVIFAAFYSVFYIYPNFNPIFEPVFLSYFAFEYQIPLIPWSFLIYTSDYILMFLTIYLLNDRFRVHQFARRILIVLVMGGTCFFLFPTANVRPPYPEVDSRFLAWVMATVRELDAPTNCFPSMHVAFTALAAWSVRYKGTKVFAFFAIWSLLIFASVLTTKQHYFWDILGGLALVVIGCRFETWLCTTRLKTLFKKWENNPLWDLSLLRIR